MEAELALGRHFGPPLPDARPAAVVALLHRRAGEWQLPLLLRPESLALHAGQIGLPGGTLEPGESSADAALRELEEELGVAPRCQNFRKAFAAVCLRHEFSDHAVVSHYLGGRAIHPLHCRGGTDSRNSLGPFHGSSKPRRAYPAARQRVLSAPHFAWGDHYVWGATAMILAELVAIVADVCHPPQRIPALYKLA